jgi:hypothetical protein
MYSLPNIESSSGISHLTPNLLSVLSYLTFGSLSVLFLNLPPNIGSSQHILIHHKPLFSENCYFHFICNLLSSKKKVMRQGDPNLVFGDDLAKDAGYKGFFLFWVLTLVMGMR